MEDENNLKVKLIFSNRWEKLLDALAERLFDTKAPFEKRYILVPNESMKEFLLFHLARRWGVAAGLYILPLDQGLSELLPLTSFGAKNLNFGFLSSESIEIFDEIASVSSQKISEGNIFKKKQGQDREKIIDSERIKPEVQVKKKVPSFLELSLAIEEKLHEVLFIDSHVLHPLKEYITAQTEELRDSRILHLSEKLAHLFMRYAIFALERLPETLSQIKWQKWLWDALFAPDAPFTFWSQVLNNASSCSCIHLFGFNYLSPLHLSFFSKSDAVFYQFSVCSQYWDDLCSDREILSLMRRRDLIEEMENYLQDRHPLLGNWGKLGREFLKSLDPYLIDVQEFYDSQERETLLAHVQNSIKELCDFSGEQTSDDSIQIHSAVCKLREVEIAKEVLETLIQRHAHSDLPLHPRDILILAVDIAEYAPYIHMVFGNSPFSYCVQGVQRASLNLFSQAFLHLLSLTEENFSLDAVFKLFSYQPFYERWGFTLEEVQLIFSWLKNAQVRVGRQSWEQGIDRLLLDLAQQENRDILPFSGVAHTDIELFDRFVSCYLALRRDLEELHSSQKRSLAQWLSFLIEVSLRHLEEDIEQQPLLRELHLLKQKTRMLQSSCFGFQSMQRIITHFCEKKTGTTAREQLAFCSMHTALRPARLIYLLGLDEESFPRYEKGSSLCALSSIPHKPYFPMQGDLDRYFFLELLSTAKDYFILSYVRVDPRDNQPRGPSYLIQELQEYVKNLSITHHPVLPESIECNEASHKRHFFLYQKNLKDREFDKEAAQIFGLERATIVRAQGASEGQKIAAKLTRSKTDSSSSFGIPPQEKEVKCPALITVQALKRLAKHPIKFYFNDVLGIYLKQQESDAADPFCLSALKKYFVKRALLQSPFEKVVATCNSRGVLPQGLFKEAAVHSLSLEYRATLEALEALQIRGEETFCIELSPHCHEAFRTDRGDWIVPALQLENEGTTLIGTLSDVTSNGLLISGKKNLETLITSWPLYLIFLQVKKYVKNIPAKMLFLGDGTSLDLLPDDSENLFTAYIDYHCRAKQSISPLMPAWASALLLKEAKDFEKAVQNSFEPNLFGYCDPYLEWMRKAEIDIDAPYLFDHWAPYLKDVCKTLIF